MTSDSSVLPLLSVVIPVRNRARLLPRCLDSFWRQSFRPLEIVVVDNGSDDGSLELARDYAAAHPDLQMKVVCEAKPGACAARNAGLRQATGHYVWFFDSDDEVCEECVSRLAAVLENEAYPDILVYHGLRESGRRLSRFPKSLSDDPVRHLLDPVVVTPNLWIRRQTLQTVLWNETLGRWQDFEWGFRVLLSRNRLVGVDEAFFLVHQSDDAISSHSFRHDCGTLLETLRAIEADIRRQPLEKQGEFIDALAYKYTSLAAELYREGQREEAESVYKIARSLMKGSKRRPIVAWHYAYTKWGGRGFWRLARLFY